MNDTSYDPITYIHHLYWRLKCLEGSPQEFQRLFEDVAERARSHFVRIRPYGSLGDRKCDGLYWGEGAVYQVYSPDEMRSAETRRKIVDDLAGAVAHWGNELKKWVFVYNARRGVPPDVVGLLQEQKARYPNIAIEPLSEGALWEIARSLTVQARAEILGPPPGLEDVFPATLLLPENMKRKLEKLRFVIVQDVLSPINIIDAVAALKPASPLGPPLFLRPGSETSFALAAEYQRVVVEDALRRSREQLPCFAVFSLSPIPLAIHLGFLLSDRVEVESFQYDRDRATWKWPKNASPDLNLEISGLPESEATGPVDAIVRVSLSAVIRREDTITHAGPGSIEVDIRAVHPNVTWLTASEQVTEIGRTFRRVLANLRATVPTLQRIHLFYAGPTPGAIVVGQAVNPRMNPPVVLYEYDRRKTPVYEPVLTIR